MPEHQPTRSGAMNVIMSLSCLLTTSAHTTPTTTAPYPSAIITLPPRPRHPPLNLNVAVVRVACAGPALAHLREPSRRPHGPALRAALPPPRPSTLHGHTQRQQSGGHEGRGGGGQGEGGEGGAAQGGGLGLGLGVAGGYLGTGVEGCARPVLWRSAGSGLLRDIGRRVPDSLARADHHDVRGLPGAFRNPLCRLLPGRMET
jgi:hypothetical protein